MKDTHDYPAYVNVHRIGLTEEYRDQVADWLRIGVTVRGYDEQLTRMDFIADIIERQYPAGPLGEHRAMDDGLRIRDRATAIYSFWMDVWDQFTELNSIEKMYTGSVVQFRKGKTNPLEKVYDFVIPNRDLFILDTENPEHPKLTFFHEKCGVLGTLDIELLEYDPEYDAANMGFDEP